MAQDRPAPYDPGSRWWWIPPWLHLPARPTDLNGWAQWFMGGLIGLALAGALWRLAVVHWYLALPGAVMLWFAADRYWRGRWPAEQDRRARLARYRLTAEELDTMTWQEFELAVRDLMRRDGIAAEHTGKPNDYSGDVVGFDPVLGETWMAQAKHYGPTTRVGSGEVQKVAGSAWPIYQARLTLVITTNKLTKSAGVFCAKAGVHVIDRDDLIRWATHGIHLHDLLSRTRIPLPCRVVDARGSKAPPPRAEHAGRRSGSRLGRVCWGRAPRRVLAVHGRLRGVHRKVEVVREVLRTGDLVGRLPDARRPRHPEATPARRRLAADPGLAVNTVPTDSSRKPG